MRVPLPCQFGEKTLCENIERTFDGVHWFHWSHGIEYTYAFLTGQQWGSYALTNTIDPKCFIEVPDSLLVDTSIKDRGFPLRGNGYMCGLHYEDSSLFVDFLISSGHNEHIRVECDENIAYKPNGKILFPPSWDTIERRQRAVCKAYHSTII